jgi:hypothetical protein
MDPAREEDVIFKMNFIKLTLYLLFAFTCKFSFALTKSDAQNIIIQSEKELIKYFDEYDKKNKCWIKKITKEMIQANGEIYGNATHFCLKIQAFEISRKSNDRTLYAFLKGAAMDNLGNEIDRILPDNNKIVYADYLFTAGIFNTSDGLTLDFHKAEFLTAPSITNTRIICIKGEARVGFLYASTKFMGRGINGFEFKPDYYIAELGEGDFYNRLNFNATKNSTFPTYKNGICEANAKK